MRNLIFFVIFKVKQHESFWVTGLTSHYIFQFAFQSGVESVLVRGRFRRLMNKQRESSMTCGCILPTQHNCVNIKHPTEHQCAWKVFQTWKVLICSCATDDYFLFMPHWLRHITPSSPYLKQILCNHPIITQTDVWRLHWGYSIVQSHWLTVRVKEIKQKTKH